MKKLLAPAALPLALAACGQGALSPSVPSSVTPPPNSVSTLPPSTQISEPPNAPTSSPIALEPSAEPTTIGRSDADASKVVHQYYSDIEARKYQEAYALWGGTSQQTLQDFIVGFYKKAHVRVALGPQGATKGAAGSLSVEVPATVTATNVDGSIHTYRGTYTLRRANDVPGATEAQLNWHIDSEKLVEVQVR
jgi:hypothetical protein